MGARSTYQRSSPVGDGGERCTQPGCTLLEVRWQAVGERLVFAEEPEEASQAYDVDDVCRGVRFESAQQVRNCSAIRQRAGRGGPGSSRYVRILG